MSKPLTYETWTEADSSFCGCDVIREATGEVIHTTSGHTSRRAAAAAARAWAKGWFAAELHGDRLVIADAAEEKVYAVTPLRSAWGRGFRLNAAEGFELAAGAESYDCCLDGDRSTCDCPAGTYRPNAGPCRHLRALEMVTRPAAQAEPQVA